MDTQNVRITTSPEMIRLLGKKLYNSPLAAILARELLQNSRDACLLGGKVALRIGICATHPVELFVDCDDNGIGMDEDTLINTFLSIGSSKKQEGAVGGFGVAKVAIFASNSWSVHTRNNFVNSDMEYKKAPKRKGTYIQTNVECSDTFAADNSRKLAVSFVLTSNCKRLTLNGEAVKTYRIRKELFCADGVRIGTASAIYSSTENVMIKNKIIWRIRGLTQYIASLPFGDDLGFNFIVDFDEIGYKPTDEGYPFSMSREKVSDHYISLVNDVISSILKNVLTARKTHERAEKKGRQARERVRINKTTGAMIVDKPEKVTLADRQIQRVWQEVIDTMDISEPAMLNREYGLIYDPGTNAQRRTNDESVYYLINPNSIKSRNIDFADSLGFVMMMWHLAVHEVAHTRQSDHDEMFTSFEHGLAAQTSRAISGNIDKLRSLSRKALKSIAAEKKLEE